MHRRGCFWLIGMGIGIALATPLPAAAQTIRTLIGHGDQDQIPALQGVLSSPTGLALDTAGNVYIGVVYPPRIVKIGPDGQMSTVAGTGVPGGDGDGGPARQAQLREPVALAVDGQGNLYVADPEGRRVRRIDGTGTIRTYVGASGRDETGVSAAETPLVSPVGLALDAAGSLYIADSGAHQVFKVTAGGTLTAVAGVAGQAGLGGDDGPATEARLNHPSGVFVARDGSIYIADDDNDRVRKVTPDGIIHTVAGGGSLDLSTGQATALRLDSPNRVFVDGAGGLWITQTSENRVRYVGTDGKMTVVAGTGAAGFGADGSLAAQTPINYPFDVAVDASGAALFTDSANGRLRAVRRDGTLATLAGGAGASGLPLAQARVVGPSGGASDSRGNLYIADDGHHRLLRITPAGTVDVIAGRGAPGYFGDDGPAALAGFGSAPARTTFLSGLAVDGQDNLYVADSLNYRIRRITPAGVITTVAGTGVSGYSGDGGPAAEAQVAELRGLAADRAGNLYFVDRGNLRVRKIDPNGVVTTVAGNGTSTYAGDGGSATGTGLPGPDALYAAPDGSLYITDTVEPRLYRVDPSGRITTVAGTGARGSSGDGAAATAAALDFPEAVAGDAAGNLYVAERYLNSIRRIDRSGVITTIAGTGSPESTGDGGPAAQAGIWRPVDLGIDASGRLVVSELGHSHRVRVIELPTAN